MKNTQLVILAGIIKAAQNANWYAPAQPAANGQVQARPAWANMAPTPTPQSPAWQSAEQSRLAVAPRNYQTTGHPSRTAQLQAAPDNLMGKRTVAPVVPAYDHLRQTMTPQQSFEHMQQPGFQYQGQGVQPRQMQTLQQMIQSGIITAGGPGQGPARV